MFNNINQVWLALVGGWPQACLNLCCESMRKRAQTDYCILLNITAYSCMAYRYFFRWVEPCKVFKIQTEPDPRRCNASSNGGASQVWCSKVVFTSLNTVVGSSMRSPWQWPCGITRQSPFTKPWAFNIPNAQRKQDRLSRRGASWRRGFDEFDDSKPDMDWHGYSFQSFWNHSTGLGRHRFPYSQCPNRLQHWCILVGFNAE